LIIATPPTNLPKRSCNFSTLYGVVSLSNCDLSTYVFGGTYLGVSRYTKHALFLLYSVSPINTIQLFFGPNTLLIYEYDINTNTILYIDQNYFI
jgi:hypothetical protein